MTIEVRGISKSFGPVRAVRGVSFSVKRGEVAGLLGANGAGKTTTMRILTGYLPPDAGNALVNGFDTIRDSLRARRSIGYLPESAPSYPEMRVSDFLRYRAGLFGLSRRERRQSVAGVLERCRIRDMRRRRIGTLSKGYRQRVGLACALLHNPSVLVLDEPTNGLDPTQILEARSLLREIAQDRTVIVSSHILHEIELTCKRVVIMARGRVCADGPIDGLAGQLGVRGRYVAEFRCGPEGRSRAIGAIGGLLGVASAKEQPERDPGWTRLHIELDALVGVNNLGEDIGQVLHRSGAVVRELLHESPGLERLFLAASAKAEGDR